MTDYIDHYNTHGPHLALQQQPPSPGRADQTAQMSPPDNVIRLLAATASSTKTTTPHDPTTGLLAPTRPFRRESTMTGFEQVANPEVIPLKDVVGPSGLDQRR